MGQQRDPNDKQVGTAINGGLYVPSELLKTPQIDTSNAIGSLTDLLGPTPAEREAQERRMLDHKNKMQMWFGLFDGLRQLGNLYATAKGASPMNLTSTAPVIDQQYQQNRQFYNDMTNYRRNYAQQLYNLHRQQQADKRTDEEHQAKLDWYKNRDEQNARKVDIQQFRAEADAAYKEASLEQKQQILEIRRMVADNLISYRDGMLKIAEIKANKPSGGGRSNAGTTKVTTTGYDENGNKVVTTTTQPNGSSGNGKYDQYIQPNSSSSSNRWDQYKVQR